jgi:hypothetical protein
MKSDIKMIIESLYDLGVIKRKKRRKKVRKLLSTMKSSSTPMSSSIPSLQETPFKNTSNLQNEYLREQLLTLENANNQKPQFRELENQIENNRIFQNQTQRALLYLHNQSNPIIEEVGYDDDDNIDVASTGGSNNFENEGVDIPVSQSSIFSFFSPKKEIAKMTTPTPFKGMKPLYDSDEEGYASPMNDEMETPQPITPYKRAGMALGVGFKRAEMAMGFGSDDEEPRAKTGGGKKSYNAERKKLLDAYKERGGDDPKILGTTTKKTIEGAIKNLDDLTKYQHLYENILNGDDETLINGDITTLGKLKAEVKKRVGAVNKLKSKKEKTNLKDLVSRKK